MFNRVQLSKTPTYSENIESCKSDILDIVKVNEMTLSGYESKNLPWTEMQVCNIWWWLSFGLKNTSVCDGWDFQDGSDIRNNTVRTFFFPGCNPLPSHSLPFYSCPSPHISSVPRTFVWLHLRLGNGREWEPIMLNLNLHYFWLHHRGVLLFL